MRISEEMKAKGILGWCWVCGTKIQKDNCEATKRGGKWFCDFTCYQAWAQVDHPPLMVEIDTEWKKEIAREEGMLNGIDSFNDWSY